MLRLFHVFITYLYIPFYEVPEKAFCPFFTELLSFLLLIYEFFT